MTLRVFDICRSGTHALGPGNRYVIWVQGCEQHCKNCITPESRLKTAGYEIDVNNLVADVILNENIDGITISGGEPFLQSAVLSHLLKEIKKVRPQLTVIAYTGLIYEHLLEKTETSDLIKQCDVIIDGQYIDELNDNKGIRGSSNQRIIPITNRLDRYLNTMSTCGRKQDRVADTAGNVTAIGIPHKTDNKSI